VGTELLVSTQAAQTTKNHKLMIVTYVWIRHKRKVVNKRKKQWPIYKQRKKEEKMGLVVNSWYVIYLIFTYVVHISFDDSYD
jgi:hypothetical protein